MKYTYWIVPGIFACLAMEACFLVWMEKRKRQRIIYQEGSAEYNQGKQSIWTRNLSNTRVGSAFINYILPAYLSLLGITAIVNQRVNWRDFTYRGFDATCIGIGSICLGVILFSNSPWVVRYLLVGKIRVVVFWIGVIGFVGAFSTALFRNI
jgi:hypothetical protein